MKLTALDIHHKEFRRSLRGYSEEDVDGFLDQVADEFDRLFKENIDLAEKLEQANERVRGYQSMEATLNNTLVAAQRSAEEIVAKAGLDADSMLRDAEIKAKEIVHNALQKKQVVANELIRIKQAEEQFRDQYRSVLQSHLRNIDEVQLPDDVNVLLDDSDGLIGTVDVRPAALLGATQAFVPQPEAAPVWAPPATPEQPAEPVAEPMPAEHPASEGVFDYAAEMASPAEQPEAAPAIEPPASGFVSSVALGEVEAPQIEPGPVELIEPGEFSLPGFDAYGEREVDTDIEEID
jgi:cell division initiation protein